MTPAPPRRWFPAFAGMTAVVLALAGCAGLGHAEAAGSSGFEEQIPADSGASPVLSPAPAPRPGLPQPITLARRPGATGGEALYVEYCAMCHAAGGMGTGLLQRRGRAEPLLEARGDLVAGFVIIAARGGIGNMPAIPRGEVSDADLQAIADYLSAGPQESAR